MLGSSPLPAGEHCGLDELSFFCQQKTKEAVSMQKGNGFPIILVPIVNCLSQDDKDSFGETHPMKEATLWGFQAKSQFEKTGKFAPLILFTFNDTARHAFIISSNEPDATRFMYTVTLARSPNGQWNFSFRGSKKSVPDDVKFGKGIFLKQKVCSCIKCVFENFFFSQGTIRC